MEYQIGTKSKAFALHTFCILSAHFIKNIYITKKSVFVRDILTIVVCVCVMKI